MILLERSGISVKATASELKREKQTTHANCWNITPVIPLMKTTGMKTTMVVRVEAVMAVATSCRCGLL